MKELKLIKEDCLNLIPCPSTESTGPSETFLVCSLRGGTVIILQDYICILIPFQDSDAPPVLEPEEPVEGPVEDEDLDPEDEDDVGGGRLLKPPRLTASSPTQQEAAQSISLSTLKSR